MWIVRLALQRPYTFIVMAMVIILLTPLVLLRTPTDIFPDINIPVISLVWTFTGLEPQEREQRITGPVERGIATLVNDVEHTESQSLNGISVIKVYFQPNANIQTALAQSAAVALPRATAGPRIIWNSSIRRRARVPCSGIPKHSPRHHFRWRAPRVLKSIGGDSCAWGP